MIKANELRLGNWVTYTEPDEKPDGTILGYEEIQKVDLDFLTVVYHNDLKIYGIPLTPEILESAGISKDHAGNFYFDVFSIKAKDGVLYFGIDYDAYGFDFDEAKPLLYVHQLQNLYFALTNKELEINLTPHIQESR